MENLGMNTLNAGPSKDAATRPAPGLIAGAPIRRVMIGVDRSQTSDRAARWAALFAELYSAELFVVQVIVPEDKSASAASAADHARADAARLELPDYARSLAGERGRGLVFIDPDPAGAIVAASEQEAVDVLVVGNLGMTGRKEFLLGNVPNRISHNARCTVIIVNTAREDAAPKLSPRELGAGGAATAARGARRAHRRRCGEAWAQGALQQARPGRRHRPGAAGQAPARRAGGAWPHLLEARADSLDAPRSPAAGVHLGTRLAAKQSAADERGRGRLGDGEGARRSLGGRLPFD